MNSAEVSLAFSLLKNNGINLNLPDHIKKEISPEILFDGADSMFKTVLSDSRVYGEYGCGKSTIWVSETFEIPTLSVDTSSEWVHHVKKTCSDNLNLKIKHVDLGEVLDWGRPRDYSKRENFQAYGEWLWQQEHKPDTILVDGRFRVFCFLNCLLHAEEGTRIIFDDYINRPQYHVVQEFVKREKVCERQCLFIVPEKKKIDIQKVENEIQHFKYVMD